MIIYSIIGAIIGAGFASGQEIYLFFFRYGIYGILGLIICCILISLVIYKTFFIIYNKDIKNYQQFLEVIFLSNKELSHIMNFIVNVFLLSTFYIMISGFGAYFEQQFGVSKILGAIALVIVVFFILTKDINGVAIANSITVPILIISIVVIGAKNIININNYSLDVTKNLNWILQPIIYCSYNMILVIPVLISLKSYIKDERQIKKIAILSGIIVFILAISIFFLLSQVRINFENLPMPAVYAISENYPYFKIIYGVVILLSIFSTAISIGISFLKNCCKNKSKYPQIVSIMCISSILISNIGFSNLVKLLFPVFGYLGIIEILFICYYSKKKL